MKISIITVCFNSVSTIEETLQSVISQDHSDIEHIIIDGGSTDGTAEVIERYKDRVAHYVSESDNGIYDAMNKGIALASGDIVGTLNADDFFTSQTILSSVATAFDDESIQAIYGDVAIVSPKNTKKTIRYYSSAAFTPEGFAYGYMPAHPTFYIRRELYTTNRGYKTDYHIAADYELLIRFLVTDRLKTKYLNLNMVTMRVGGRTSSSLHGYYILNKEVIRACRENGIKTGWFKILGKYFNKLKELRNPVVAATDKDD